MPEPADLTSMEAMALGRLAFGPSPEETAAFRRGGTTLRTQLQTYLEVQLQPAGIKDAACDRRLAALNLATLGKSLERLWKDHGAGPLAVREQPLREVELATWVRAVYSRRQLQEVMTDFWHGHFSVFGPARQVAPVFAHYDREVIRPQVLGNFRRLLAGVAQSPALLFYLDNQVNQSGNPNENYARELFERHTLGADHYLGAVERAVVPGYAAGTPEGYVDSDVYEAARCFTGWRPDVGYKSGGTGAFLYFDPWHDHLQKTVLGRRLAEQQPPLKDGQDVLDILCAHPGTALHVSRRLCARLIADDPPPRLVAAAAQVFQAAAHAADQLGQVVRTIVLSEEFAATRRAKLRRPFELMAAALRATGAELAPDEAFLQETARGGQRLFHWPMPDGYPDRREAWGSTALMAERWRFCNQLAAGKLPGVTLDLLGTTPPACRSPRDLAGHWLPRLLGPAVEGRTRNAVVTYLAQGRSPSLPLPATLRAARLGPALALALMSPEFQWR